MLFNFMKKAPLLDVESIDWMFATFAWALKHFGTEAFKQSQLINPSNQHFPGRANSVDEMAELIFNRVREYAGMNHWPLMLVNEETISTLPPQPQVLIEGPLRSFKEVTPMVVDASSQLIVAYHPYQINDPEVLIGSYAHTLAHYLGTTTKEPPPGGVENWPHVTELLAVFLGFGIMMANSAHTNKVRSCGSCAGPIVERTNFLSQYDITYALAIFCHLKDIPTKSVTPFLKKSLHSFFKKAMKDVQNKKTENEQTLLLPL